MPLRFKKMYKQNGKCNINVDDGGRQRVRIRKLERIFLENTKHTHTNTNKINRRKHKSLWEEGKKNGWIKWDLFIKKNKEEAKRKSDLPS